MTTNQPTYTVTDREGRQIKQHQDELAMLREFVDEVTRILDDQINGHLTAYDATVAIAQELVNIQRSNA